MVVLHAVTVMHGVAFDLGDGLTRELQAGFQNPNGCLEVTALLTLKGYSKNVSMKVGLLWTDLQGFDYVDSALVAHPRPRRFGIELKDAVVVPIGEVVANQKHFDGTAVIRVK